MPKICYLCLTTPASRRPKEVKISFHQFPKNPITRQAWFQICGLSEITDDMNNIYICSSHFTLADYQEPNARLLGGRMVLKESAVPSIALSVNHPQPPFEVASSSSQSFKAPRQPVEPSPSLSVTTREDEVTSTPKKRRFAQPRFVSEITAQDLTPGNAEIVLDIIRRNDAAKTKRIKALHSQQSYILKRIAAMSDLILDLNQKTLISDEGGNTLLLFLEKILTKRDTS